jgi:hypothetical protein
LTVAYAGFRGAFIGATLLLGCEAPATTAREPKAPPAAPAVRAREGLGEGRGGEYVSKRFGVRVPLPDGQAWRIDDHTGSWLSATHGPSGSVLLLRAWREDGVVNRARCEEKARLYRNLPERALAEIVEQKAVGVPKDFDTVVEVGVIASREPGKEGIMAFAMAFGGWARRCFAYVFTTSARGKGTEEIVGERLGTMVQGSLEKLVFESDIDPRIERGEGRGPEGS